MSAHNLVLLFVFRVARLHKPRRVLGWIMIVHV
jgi:hypothetical protein